MNDLVRNPDPAPAPTSEPATDAPNARDWRAFVVLISAIWHKGAADYIECGRHLIQAKAELQSGAYGNMLKQLRFDISMVKKLVCIAKKTALSSHVNCLPPCYSTIYCLSQLADDVIEAAVADKRIHFGMTRRDAVALKPAKTTTTATMAEMPAVPPANPPELNVAWQAASLEQRRAFLDEIGRDGLCAAMSNTLMSDLRDRVVDVSLAGASKTTKFAGYATNKFHTAMYSATQLEPDMPKAMAALGCIAKQATAAGIAHSDVVIAQGAPKGGRKK